MPLTPVRPPGARGGLGPTTQFAFAGLIALLVLLVGAALIVRALSLSEARHDAEQLTRAAAVGIVQPRLDAALLRGDPRALTELDGAIRRQLLRPPLMRVKLWTEHGEVLYSDEPRLMGARFSLEEDARSALAGHGDAVHISVADGPENRYERDLGKLLEVYVLLRGPRGERVLLETYTGYAWVTGNQSRLWLAFAPPLLGVLVLLGLIQLTLGWSTIRRLRRTERERRALALRVADASDAERRRVTADLHDTVVQDLVAASFALSATAQRLDADPARRAVLDAAAATREAVRALRSALVDIYPPDLRTAGLASALSDLAQDLRSRGVAVDIAVPARLSLPAETERLVYRTAREALRNVERHAEATSVRLVLAVRHTEVMLEVRDDGRGIAQGDEGEHGAADHLGLRLLQDFARESGGRLDVRGVSGQGTVVRLCAPAHA